VRRRGGVGSAAADGPFGRTIQLLPREVRRVDVDHHDGDPASVRAHLGSNQGPPACEAESGVHVDEHRRAEVHYSRRVSWSGCAPWCPVELGNSPFSHHRSDRDAGGARSKNCSPPRRARRLCGAHLRASHTVRRVTTARRRTPPRLPDCRHPETAKSRPPDAARNPLSHHSGTAFRSVARVARRLPRRTHA
jgi:hypothetical protein